jgi:RHS repeat-associated protein
MEPATPANPNGEETILESFTYAYNNATGNITRITTANGEYTDYTYDLLDRLTCEEKKTQAGQRIYKIEYLFDNNDAKNGNIHQVIVNETDTTTFTYNQMNQLTTITNPDTSTETQTYDDNGNLTQSVNNTTGEVTTYTWDCFNRMTGISNSGSGATTGESVGFTYDGEHKLTRIADSDQTVDLRQTGIDTITKIARIRQSNSTEKTIVSHNIIGNGQILSKYGETGTKSQICLHYDHNSNLTIITDAHGRIVEKPLMDAYGNILPHETAIPGIPAGSPQNQPAKTLQQTLLTGSAGVIYLHKARMYNMRRRFYNNIQRRFQSFDPYADTSQGYDYAGLSPVMNSDPSGLIKIGNDKHGMGNFPNVWRSDTRLLWAFYEAGRIVKDSLSKSNCICALANYCKKKMSPPQAKWAAQWFINNYFFAFAQTSLKYADKKQKLAVIAETSEEGGAYFGHLYLGAAILNIAKIMLHEMAHSGVQCGVPGELNGTVYFEDHGCCDVIAAECLGEGSLIPGNQFLSNMKKLIPSLKQYATSKNRIGEIPSLGDVDKLLGTQETDLEYIKRVQVLTVKDNWDMYKIPDFQTAKAYCKTNY